jgi:hypothetical protein
MLAVSPQLIKARYEMARRRELPIVAKRKLSAAEIETEWRTWLDALFPNDFSSPHAWFHAELWEWLWASLQAKRVGEPLPRGNALFDIIFRGGGKSHHCRRAPIAEAALVGKGYCLYVSATQDLANNHVSEISSIIEESNIGLYYPKIAQVKKGKLSNQSKGWRQDYLHTEQGYVIRGVGLDVGVRGTNVNKMRPSLIVLDDIDELNESPEVTKKHMDTLLRSVLPTKTASTIILSAQNLIHDGSIINQFYTGEVRALLDRTVVGPVPAVEGLETESRLRPDGLVEDVIVAGKSTWPDGYPLSRAQEDINTMTLEAFEAECQHDLSAKRNGRILTPFDENVHLITVDQFKEKFGTDTFPTHWQQYHTHDAGYTGDGAHPGVFFFLGVAAANSPMPGALFIAPEIYLGEKGITPDHAAERYLSRVLNRADITADLKKPWTDEQRKVASQAYANWLSAHENVKFRMSHEQLATRRTFRKYGMTFNACNPGAAGGIQQMVHYHKVDYSKPHPFHADRMGVSNAYWIVANDQLDKARNEWGMARGRTEAKKWVWRTVKDTETGLTKEMPRKAYDDFMNAAMMAFYDMGFLTTPKTKQEAVEDALPSTLKASTIEAITDPAEKQQRQMTRQIMVARVKVKPAGALSLIHI